MSKAFAQDNYALLATMSDEGIQALLLERQAEMARVREQIARAKAKVAETGDYSDSDWFHSANRALRHMGIEHQRLQHEMSARKKRKHEEGQAKHVDVGRAFMKAAKAMLPHETYMHLVRMAVADQKVST